MNGILKLHCFNGAFALAVPFYSIVGFAEYLAVRGDSRTSLAPSSYVIRIHFFESPDLSVVGGLANDAERAVRFPASFSLSRLLFVGRTARGRIEHTHIEELGVG